MTVAKRGLQESPGRKTRSILQSQILYSFILSTVLESSCYCPHLSEEECKALRSKDCDLTDCKSNSKAQALSIHQLVSLQDCGSTLSESQPGTLQSSTSLAQGRMYRNFWIPQLYASDSSLKRGSLMSSEPRNHDCTSSLDNLYTKAFHLHHTSYFCKIATFDDC